MVALRRARRSISRGPDRAHPVKYAAIIRLPPEITFDKRPLPGNGGWSFDFRHRTLGALGRILLQDLPGRGTHVSYEVTGDLADPRTAERRKIFEPLGREIAQQMERATGPVADRRPYAAPPPPVAPTERVEGKLTQCPRCGAVVAMLVFAPEATDTGRFEDCARLMYPEYSQRGLPNWIIGPAQGPGPEDSAELLQVWPIRKPLQRLTPGKFNARLDRLAARHCG